MRDLELIHSSILLQFIFEPGVTCFLRVFEIRVENQRDDDQ